MQNPFAARILILRTRPQILNRRHHFTLCPVQAHESAFARWRSADEQNAALLAYKYPPFRGSWHAYHVSDPSCFEGVWKASFEKMLVASFLGITCPRILIACGGGAFFTPFDNENNQTLQKVGTSVSAPSTSNEILNDDDDYFRWPTDVTIALPGGTPAGSSHVFLPAHPTRRYAA